jgi:hypothetical protein
MKKLLFTLSFFIATQINAQIISTVAGTGSAGNVDGAATIAQFSNPESIATSTSGAIYVADVNNNCIRMVVGNTVTTLAGSGIAANNDGIGFTAAFSNIRSLTCDLNDNVYVNCGTRVRKIDPSGVVTTLSNIVTGIISATGSGVNIWDIVYDASINQLVITDQSGFIFRSTTVGVTTVWSSTGGSYYGKHICVRPAGGYYMNCSNGNIALISSAGGISNVINSLGANGVIAHPTTSDLYAIKNNQVYVYQNMIWTLTKTFFSVAAGNLDGISASAKSNTPSDLSFNPTNVNELFIADKNNHKIRAVLSSTVIISFGTITNPSNKVGCEGASYTLSINPSNATNYQWLKDGTALINNSNYSGVNTGTLVITNYNATLTGTYTALYANTFTTASTSSASGVYAVGINPTITSVSSGPSSTVCPGQNTVLGVNGTGIFTYQWSSGAGTQVATVFPTTTTIYTITVHNTAIAGSDCIATRTIQVNVKSTPVLTITALSDSICLGHSTSLTVVGANTYTWSTTSNSSSITVTPNANATYSVVGKGTNGCNTSLSHSITVNSLPILNITTTKAILCTRETATLTTAGAQTYTWSNSSNGGFVIVNPIANTIYTVTGEDINGCLNTTSFTQSVSLCTGINNQEKELGFSIYPNPNNGLVNIESNSLSASATIQLVDLTGRIIFNYSITSTKEQLDISHLSNGIYFLSFKNNGQSYIRKIIKE